MGKSPIPWRVTLQYAGIAVSNLCKRDDVVIATKFLLRTPEDIEAGITGQQHIEKMLDKSLENLGMDYAAPLYDIMEGLNNAVNAGQTHSQKKRILQNLFQFRDIIILFSVKKEEK